MIYILLAALIAALDQWFKSYLVAHAAALEGTRILPGLLGLTFVRNTGASWGMLAGKTDLLLLVTGVVCAAVFVALLADRPVSRLGRLALGMVLGGAVGNAVDRLLHGYVVDMFQTLFMDFPIFNIADCFITVGGGLFCLYIILEELEERRRKARQRDARLRRLIRESEELKAEELSVDEILLEFTEEPDDTGTDRRD